MIQLNKCYHLLVWIFITSSVIHATALVISSDQSTIAAVSSSATNHDTTSYVYSRFQTRIKYQIKSSFTLNTWFDMESYWTNKSLSSLGINSHYQNNKLPITLYKSLYKSDFYQLNAVLKRAYAVISLFNSDLRYGLQQFPVGVGIIFRPTDIINTYDVLNQMLSDQLGLVGILYQYNLSPVAQWQVMITHNDKRLIHKGLRLLFNINKIDISTTYINYEGGYMIGVDYVSGIEKLGSTIYSEIAMSQANNTGNYGIEIVFGFNTFVYDHLRMILELYAKHGNLNKLYQDNSNQKWSFQSSYYLANQLQYQLGPLLSVSHMWILNMNDMSLVSLPRINLSLRENLDGMLGGSYVFGDSHTEFNTYQNQIIVGLNYFF